MVEIRHETVFDTNQQHLGAVYAKALLGATEKAGNTEAIMAEMDSLVGDVLDGVPRLEDILSSPRVPYERKEEILERAFRGQMTADLLNFLKILARRGRFECLRAVHQAAQKRFNDLRGRTAVQVRSAESLDEATLALIRSRLEVVLGGDVDLHLKVDARLVAGLVIRVGDTVYDGSVANQLLRLRDDMISKTNQKIRIELERFAKTD